MIRPDKEEGQAIRAAAAVAGQSVQAYVLQAVRERMGREVEQIATSSGHGFHISPDAEQGSNG